MPAPSAGRSPSTAEIPAGPLAYVRFASEIAMLVGLAFAGGWLGGRTGDSGNIVASTVLAIGFPVAAAVIWGQFIGPRGPHRLADPTRFGLEVVLFGVAAALLIVLGHWVFAIVVLALYAAGTWHGRQGG